MHEADNIILLFRTTHNDITFTEFDLDHNGLDTTAKQQRESIDKTIHSKYHKKLSHQDLTLH